MVLLLKGNRLIATEAMTANVLMRLVSLAVRRPLCINGEEVSAYDLERLAEEAKRTGRPVQFGDPASAARHLPQSRSPRSVAQLADVSVHIEPSGDMVQKGDAKTIESKFRHTHQAKVLAHLTAKLFDLQHLSEQAEVTKRLRSFLKVEEARLRIARRLGAQGQWTAAARSFVFDALIAHIFKAVADGPGADGEASCAIVALGGYGRRELAPFSDIDLLFLHTNHAPAATREMIERIQHLLWDASLNVGHRYHTIAECVSAARIDAHLQTALVTARLVAGDATLFERLSAALKRERRRNAQSLLETVRSSHEDRHQQYGRAIYLQEPNVKESVGGLRDLHTALWAASARYDCRTLAELRTQGFISEDEYRRAEGSYDFLLRVRQEAHWLTNRKTDRLALDLQPTLAEEFGYKASPHIEASESFMRDYYARARELHLFSESLLARASESAEPTAGAARSFDLLRRERRGEVFWIKNKQLQLEGDARLFMQNPLLIFEAFAFAQAADVPLSHHLRQSINRSLTVVDRDFRCSAEAAHLFLRLLQRRGRVGRALRSMHETGFLGRYLPEFNRISLLIQHDLYHHYTIDEHTLRCIEAVDNLTTSEGEARASLRSAFDEVENVALIYLSILLHDLGKGQGKGHAARGAVIAARICQRLNLDPVSASKVVSLVQHHLLMAHVSQRRNLSEGQVVTAFTTEIKSLDVLNMLLLLTYADLHGTGPLVWSEWKGALLLELYRRARFAIVGGPAPLAEGEVTAQLKQRVNNLLAGEIRASEIERHFALLPARYARATSAVEVIAHLRLIEALDIKAFVCRWYNRTNHATALTICARDRRGLFADIAGALASQGIEILSADLYTREDGFVIDTLVLREAAGHGAVAEHRWATIERGLHLCLTVACDVGAQVERWRTQNAPRHPKTSSRAKALSVRRRVTATHVT
nr:[protein-PII] uridylyltransferase [Pyrinomonadaceae bacterium]